MPVAPPGLVDIDPGMVDVPPGLTPLALFMLFGPLAADGEPAEFDMPLPEAPPYPPMADPLPPEVAWDGLALAAEAPVADVGELLLDAPAPVPPAPVPMVWARPAVALIAKAAPAIMISFIIASTRTSTVPPQAETDAIK